MFVVKADRKWSDIGLRVLIASIVGVIVVAFADAYLKSGAMTSGSSERYLFLGTLIIDFRYTLDQAVYASTIFFVGAKFFETRTILTVGFDKLDNNKISIKGPDENNTVWIGHRYGTKMEAEAIASALTERLKESADKNGAS